MDEIDSRMDELELAAYDRQYDENGKEELKHQEKAYI